VPELCEGLSQKCPDDAALKFGVYELCIENGFCYDWHELEAFGLAHFHRFGIGLAQAAVRAGVVESLPRLINAAVHALGSGGPDITELLTLFAQRYAANGAIAQALLRAFASELATGHDRDDCLRLLAAVKQANPDGVLEFAMEVQKEPAIREIIAGLVQT
jgi:hypothetical protein